MSDEEGPGSSPLKAFHEDHCKWNQLNIMTVLRPDHEFSTPMTLGRIAIGSSFVSVRLYDTPHARRGKLILLLNTSLAIVVRVEFGIIRNSDRRYSKPRNSHQIESIYVSAPFILEEALGCPNWWAYTI